MKDRANGPGADEEPPVFLENLGTFFVEEHPGQGQAGKAVYF